MQTIFEQFALNSMLGQPDTPPRANGTLCFAFPWERQVFGVALALARDGVFEWEDFRQALITEIRGWETGHALDDASWNYYERWLSALERMVAKSSLDAAMNYSPGSESPVI